MNKTAFLILLVFLVGAAGAYSVWDGDDGSDVVLSESEAWLDEDPEVGELDATPLEAEYKEPEEANGAPPEGLEAISREEVASADGDARFLVV